MSYRTSPLLALAVLLGGVLSSAAVAATAPPSSKAVDQVDGKYVDADGNPTYKIAPDGTVDWYTFSGYRRFNGTCNVCHGFGGSGSTFAPDLTASLKTLSYADFMGIVASGKQDVNSSQNLVMPAFGDNKNVMCYVDDIYVYLRARSDGVLGPERPAKRADKPPEAKAAEDACMGP